MAHILVIDDDTAVRVTIKVILEDEGHQVTVASDGDQGLKAFAGGGQQLVITDIIMPIKEGIETIMQLRALDAKTPIIAISGGGWAGNSDFLQMAIEFGASEVLRKPFEREELIGAVSRLLLA